MTYFESIFKVLDHRARARRRPACSLRRRTGGLLQRGRRYTEADGTTHSVQPGDEVFRYSAVRVRRGG